MSKITRLDPKLGREDWKGSLTLIYPSNADGPSDQQKVIPFFENPSIAESQTPRYANYGVVGRSSNLFGYLGADSRKINIKFRLTLPHLYEISRRFDQIINSPPTKWQKRREILQGEVDTAAKEIAPDVRDALNAPAPGVPVEESLRAGGGSYSFSDHLTTNIRNAKGIMQSKLEDPYNKLAAHDATHPSKGVAEEYDQKFNALLTPDEQELIQTLISDSGHGVGSMYSLNSPGNKARRQVLNAISSIVAAIRSTVVNNSVNPQYGPPLVRLNFGMLYNDVPCICKGYNVSIQDKATYDVETLIPRNIEISLNLEEARNLKRNQADKIEADNLVGWEVLLGSDVMRGITMDPGNFALWNTWNTGEDL